MTCQVIEVWTFARLVGAFLDLGITFLLLCVSALAFIVSKFLGLFGQRLPCPCDGGLFGNPNSSKCFHTVLVCRPSEKISLVQSSLKHKFPFDSILTDDIDHQMSSGQNKSRGGHVEVGVEGSCNSDFLEKRVGNLFGGDSVLETERGVGTAEMDSPNVKFDFDVKAFESRRLRHTLRHRYGGVARSWSFSPISANEVEKRTDDSEVALNTSVLGRDIYDFRLHEEHNENNSMEQNVFFPEDFPCNGLDKIDSNLNDKDKIKFLEKALKKEHAAQISLLLELEKERSAAATAADEAMAMILRLQEEKANVEMESRQYQRMVDEKSAYDAEEMNILKEILMRREREKHCLEKEIEAYRQIMFESECANSRLEGISELLLERYSSLISSENPLLMPQQHAESAFEEFKSKREEKHCLFSSEKGLPIHEMCENVDFKIDCGEYKIIEDLLEKEIVGTDENKLAKQSDNSVVGICSELNHLRTRVCESNEDTVFNKTTELEDNASTNEESPTTETYDSSNNTHFVNPVDGDSKEVLSKETDNGTNNVISHAIGTQPSVHDVHVIEDAPEMYNKPLNPTLSMPVKCDSPTLSWKENGLDRNRSTLVDSGLPPKSNSQGKPLLSDLRRNSMSAVDYERFRIDSEVGWLHERLRIVQASRAKLKLPTGRRQKENSQLHILGDITSQLHGPQQLTVRGKTEMNASLPSLSKIISKNRQWRSVSLDVHRSS